MGSGMVKNLLAKDFSVVGFDVDNEKLVELEDLGLQKADITGIAKDCEVVILCLPNGESYEDVKLRISDFLNFIKREYDGKHIAIVAHKAPQLALDVLLKGTTWDEAFANDWRKQKAWKPGWEYEA